MLRACQYGFLSNAPQNNSDNGNLRMQGTWLKRVGENKDEDATSNQGKQSRVTLRFSGLKFAHLCIQLFCIKPFVLHTIQSFFVEKMWKRKTGCNADMKSFVYIAGKENRAASSHRMTAEVAISKRLIFFSDQIHLLSCFFFPFLATCSTFFHTTA